MDYRLKFLFPGSLSRPQRPLLLPTSQESNLSHVVEGQETSELALVGGGHSKGHLLSLSLSSVGVGGLRAGLEPNSPYCGPRVPGQGDQRELGEAVSAPVFLEAAITVILGSPL